MRAEIVGVDGSRTETDDVTLEAMQAAVGGCVERIRVAAHHGGGVLLVDEDANMKTEKPDINRTASHLAGTVIRGPAVWIRDSKEWCE